MEHVGEAQFLTGKTATECLQKAPIVRGWDHSNHPEQWMIVGSGRKLEVVNRSAHKIAPSADKEGEWAKWEDLISSELVQFLRKTKFARYQCPSCNSSI
jgi:hypothetical protein